MPFCRKFRISFSAVVLLGVTEVSVQAQKSAEHFFTSEALKGAVVTATLTDLVTGEVLETFRPDERLCPASVWKIFVTAAALEELGPDFRFRTVLAYRGAIHGHTLRGDLLIIGGGDPALGSRHFGEGVEALLNDWTAAVKAAGIDSVTGAVIANAAHFRGDGIPRTRIWEDMANYYGAAVSGLNIHDNTYFVDFTTQSEPGMPASINFVRPEVPELKLTGEVYSSTVRSDLAYIFGAPGSSERKVRGTLPLGQNSFTVKGSLPDPPLFAAFHLRKALLQSGVFVAGPYMAEVDAVPEPATVTSLSEHRSPPLSDIVRHTLTESDNLMSEVLLFQLGARSGDATLEGGLAALLNHYAGFTGLEHPFFAYDGSGLSRFNAVSSRMVTQVLVRAAQRDVLNGHLIDALPLAGKEGTVRYFAKNTNLDGNLRLKSGSMDKVKAYAGVFQTYTGRQLAFAFAANNFSGSPVEVRIAVERWLVAAYGNY